MIDWTPISDMPDDLKDGREVLMWINAGFSGGDPFAQICMYDIRYNWQGWIDTTEHADMGEPTHYCEITPPKE